VAAEIDGDELAPWLAPLIALAGEIGSTVAFESIASGADGFYRPKTKAIVVEAAHSPNRRVKTLVPWRKGRIPTFGMPLERPLSGRGSGGSERSPEGERRCAWHGR
jgi:hypothetical protein